MHRSPQWSHSYRITIWIFLCIYHSHIHATWLSHNTFLQFIIVIHIMLNCYNTYKHPYNCEHIDYET
jgi:hypothetical protein